MSRGRQIVRQWKLLATLAAARREGLSMGELADGMGEACSRRTLYRDLLDLQEAGFPLRAEDARWYVLEPTEGGLTIPLDPTELIALTLVEDLLGPVRGSYLERPLRELRARLLAMMTPKGRKYLGELRRMAVVTLFAPSNYEARSTQLDAIEESIHKEQRLAIRYHKPGHEPEERVVEPYVLQIYGGGRLYLIARCTRAEDVRTFAVDRVLDARVLDETFEMPGDFDPGAYVRRGFGVFQGEVLEFRIGFAPRVAHLVRERRYHPTQRIEEREDGGVVLAMRCAGLPEVAAWVASFGGAAVPLAPPELCAAVRALHERGLEALHGCVPG